MLDRILAHEDRLAGIVSLVDAHRAARAQRGERLSDEDKGLGTGTPGTTLSRSTDGGRTWSQVNSAFHNPWYDAGAKLLTTRVSRGVPGVVVLST